MKTKIYLIVILLMAGSTLISCFKDKALDPGVPTKDISVSILKTLYEGKDVVLSESNVGITPLAGTIISDAASGNIEQNRFVIVQTKNDETAGIVIDLGNASSIPLTIGDSIVFDIQGAMLTRVDGILQLKNIDPKNIHIVAKDRVVEPVLLSLSQLSEEFEKFESTLVKVAGVDIEPTPSAGEVYAGQKGLFDGTDGVDIKLYTLPDASFADEPLPLNGSFVGIPIYDSTPEAEVKQLRIRRLEDVTTFSIEHNTPIIITGYMSNPRGYDAHTGSEDLGNGVIIDHLGGFEYMQFMATEDIDFSVTPFSVMTSKTSAASVAPDGGWVVPGSARQYKFNLTEGKADKGTYFYVGGPEKRIAGYSTMGKSTDISETAPIPENRANWIRTRAYASLAGDDGFQSKRNDLLYDNSNMTGIAVFAGTNVTPASVPVDAIFYGDPIGVGPVGLNSLFDETHLYGFLVPNNDYYINSTEQSYFGQGTNTFVFPKHPQSTSISNKGTWFKLGGVYDSATHTWITPRNMTYEVLMADGTEPDTPQLSDIESSNGITRLRR